MTRALVTQMLEALEHGYMVTGAHAKYTAAITAARAYLETEPSGGRAELIEKLRWAGSVGGNQTCIQAADMLEADADLRTQLARRAVERNMAISMAISMLVADAQQANKPTGWDSGLSQDYCAEFGQWLASRPGARQQIKAMFEAADESEDLK